MLGLHSVTHLTLAVGLPGAGKSTWFARHGIKPVSTDAIRELLTGDPQDQIAQDEATELLLFVARARLERGVDTYVDATNTVARARARFVQLAGRQGVTVRALLFDTLGETCLARNEQRTVGKVPDATMVAMMEQFERPTLAEGFDQILIAQSSGYRPEVHALSSSSGLIEVISTTSANS